MTRQGTTMKAQWPLGAPGGLGHGRRCAPMGLAEQLRRGNATGVCEEKWRCCEFIVLHEHMSHSTPKPSLLDGVMDALVVPGYSRIGYALRSHGWKPSLSTPLEGRRVVVTGHTSGIGFAVGPRDDVGGAKERGIGDPGQRAAAIPIFEKRLTEDVLADALDHHSFRLCCSRCGCCRGDELLEWRIG